MPEVQDEVQVFEASQLPIPPIIDDPWERGKRAFFLMLPELLKTLRGKYVAVHNGEVVQIGDTVRSVLLSVRERFPRTEIYIQLVDETLPVVKMRSPRRRLR